MSLAVEDPEASPDLTHMSYRWALIKAGGSDDRPPIC